MGMGCFYHQLNRGIAEGSVDLWRCGVRRMIAATGVVLGLWLLETEKVRERKSLDSVL